MCILFATREHPNYELILISNRDEFFERETHNTCWHNNGYILSPYDMAKKHIDFQDEMGTFGTWLGINRKGRISNILNLRLESSSSLQLLVKPKSRGIIPFIYLSTDPERTKIKEWDTYEKFELKYSNLSHSGDFNFFYGDIKEKTYRIIDSLGHTFNVLDDNNNGSFVLSNNIFDVDSKFEWNKIKLGRKKWENLINDTKDCTNDDNIISHCFKLASICSIEEEVRSTPYHINPRVTFDTIYVPPLGCDSNEDIGLTLTKGNYYGTRSQIVVLVSRDSKHVTVVEKVLHTSDSDINVNSADNPKEMRRFHFDLY